ncbi:protein Btn1p [Diutina catenulata]
MVRANNTPRVFTSFFLLGLVNNVLYVIILSAAVDLVGASTPKATVLLANIVPSFAIKVAAPFFIHHFEYGHRVTVLMTLSFSGMLMISLSSTVAAKIFGIVLASTSSGMGEITFLQLTHYYGDTAAVGGWSSGTGGAGIAGSLYYLLLTNIWHLSSWKALFLSSLMPFALGGVYYGFLPSRANTGSESVALDNDWEVLREDGPFSAASETVPAWKTPSGVQAHFSSTMARIRPLVAVYMIPLASVYLAEYVINQGISPTLLFPLDEVPQWLIRSHRDTYVVYGFLYQLGVFISRSSANFGFRVRKLPLLAVLQTINVAICVVQSMSFTIPFGSIWPLFALMIYEGLLGGLAYINTFMLVSEQSSAPDREFNMGAVSMSDSFGIVLAGIINWVVETSLCRWQQHHGRDWCASG